MADGVGRASRHELIGRKNVKRLRAGETLWDTDVRGFGVTLQNSRRLYFLSTRVGGPERSIVIGPDEDPWTPESARREAWRIKSQLMSQARPKRSGIAAREVARLKPGQVIWDDEVRGFGVRCQRQAKVYVVKTRLEGRQRWFTIGREGAPWTPETARAEAKRLIGEVKAGRDPGYDKALARGDLTVAQLCKLYLAEGCAGKSRTTLAIDQARIARHVRPLLGRRKLRTITPADIDGLIRGIAESREEPQQASGPARRLGGPGTARRTLGLLGAIFAFAEARGLRDDNPVRAVAPPKDAEPAPDLRALDLVGVDAGLRPNGSGTQNANAEAAIRLIALTGCRSEEVLGLRWRQVDLEGARLMLSEGGRGLPLGAPALALLGALPRGQENDRVFPEPGLREAVAALWQSLRRRAGLPNLPIDALPRALAGFV